jgi:hypothetical protein
MEKKDLNLLIKDFKKVKKLEEISQKNLEEDLEVENEETLNNLVKYLKKNDESIKKLEKFDKKGVEEYTNKDKCPVLYYLIKDLVDNMEKENYEKCHYIKHEIFGKY